MDSCGLNATFSSRIPSGSGRRYIEELYRRDHKALVRRLRRILKNEDDAEELAQLAFVKLMEAGPALESLRCGHAYLFRVAHNLAIDHLRHGKVGQRIFKLTDLDVAERQGELAEAFEDAESAYVARDMLRRVDLALVELPAKCRSAFVMSRSEEKTYPEIAEVMGLSVSMIEKYMSRAVNHIRTQLPPEPLAA